MFQTDEKKKTLNSFWKKSLCNSGLLEQDSRTWELMEVLEPGSESGLWEDREANNLRFTDCMDPATAM